jgi:hypothetical protein
MSVIHALVNGMIDYAGLFPPTSLEMPAAVRNYAEYANGDDSWALGRFIVPLDRLPEFTDAFNEVCCDEREKAWLLSVLGSSDPDSNGSRIAAFTQGAVLIDTLELKASDPQEAEQLLSRVSLGLTSYLEFAPEAASEMLPVLDQYGARAKIRMGGLTPDAYPSPATVTRFLFECADAQVPFKATAGLHHPVSGTYHLTYAPDSPSHRMYGFVNVFLAAALAHLGKEEEAVMATLEEESPSSFKFSNGSVRWHGNELTLGQVGTMRRDFAIDFGSCSFSDPIEELKVLRWL